jgi:hypothetical protein
VKDEPAVFALVVFGRPSRKVAEVVVAFENPAAAAEFARARRIGEYVVAPLGFVATAVPTVPYPRPAVPAANGRPAAPADTGRPPELAVSAELAVPAKLAVSAGRGRPRL